MLHVVYLPVTDDNLVDAVAPSTTTTIGSSMTPISSPSSISGACYAGTSLQLLPTTSSFFSALGPLSDEAFKGMCLSSLGYSTSGMPILHIYHTFHRSSEKYKTMQSLLLPSDFASTHSLTSFLCLLTNSPSFSPRFSHAATQLALIPQPTSTLPYVLIFGLGSLEHVTR